MRLCKQLLLTILVATLGCGTKSSTPVTADSATQDTAPLDATSIDTAVLDTVADALAPEPTLQCPNAGALPFTLASTGWQQKSTQDLANSLPRNKDEAHDLLGNPGGPWLTTDMAYDATPTTGAQVLHGRKARTAPDGGLDTTGLPGEFVSLWLPQAGGWTQAGRMLTAADGTYAITLPAALAFGTGLHAAYAFLESEPSCTIHFGLVKPAKTQFIVTDIDGTLTTADTELTLQLIDLTHDPAQKTGAAAMVQAWAAKGYAVVYLSARGHRMRAETRPWLDKHGYPTGLLLTADDLVFGETARKHKRIWVDRLHNVLGWQAAAAYGNADSDFHAYADAGLDKSRTFIIGPLAGSEGTVAIPNDDYTAHTATFVAAQPHAP